MQILCQGNVNLKQTLKGLFNFWIVYFQASQMQSVQQHVQVNFVPFSYLGFRCKHRSRLGYSA